MSKKMAAMTPAFPRSKGKSKNKAKTVSKLSGQTEGYTPKGALRGGGTTTRDARARIKRLEKAAL